LSFCLFQRSAHPRDLHPFPTRRSSDLLLLVLTLKSGVVRSIFVEVPARLAPEAVAQVGVVLNERLAGLTLREIRGTLSERLRDRSEEHTSELQSRGHLVCRLLLEKKKA